MKIPVKCECNEESFGRAMGIVFGVLVVLMILAVFLNLATPPQELDLQKAIDSGGLEILQ